MKKILLSLCFCLSVQFLSSCAAQQEDPPTPDPGAPTSSSWQLRPEESETVAIPTPQLHVDPEREYFVLPTDSARITDDGSAVWVAVRGPLANGCQRHEYYDSVSKGTTLYLTYWGSRPTDSTVVCTEQTQGFDREIHIENSKYTKFNIVQPNGRTLAYSLGTPQISAK